MFFIENISELLFLGINNILVLFNYLLLLRLWSNMQALLKPYPAKTTSHHGCWL